MSAKCWIIVCAAILIVPQADFAQQPDPYKTDPYKTEETPLGALGGDINGAPVFSNDGLHLAFCAPRGPKVCVVLDAKAGAEYDAINRILGSKDQLEFSPDSHRLAYIAIKDNKARLVADDQEGPECNDIKALIFSPDSKHLAYNGYKDGEQFLVIDGQSFVDSFDLPEFSPDGKRLARLATRNGKQSVVLDGQSGVEYEEISYGPIFSDDGKHLAYAAKRGENWLEVVDGREGSAYEKVGLSRFSPDGKHLAYWAEKGKYEQLQHVVVLDGEEGAGCDPGFDEEPPVFSPPGDRLAYRCIKRRPTGQGGVGRPCVVVDGVAGAEFDWIPNYLVFSPDGKRLAYYAQNHTKWLVVVDGQGGKEYEECSSLTFSPDGAHVTYSVKKDGNALVVVDGQEYGSLLTYPIFSPDGKHVTFVASRGETGVVMVDGRVAARCDGPLSPAFSPDGKRLAYATTKNGKWSVVVDGQLGEEYDGIGGQGLNFSPDGKRLAYVAEKDGKQLVAIGGYMGASYDIIGPKLKFDTNGDLEYLAVKDKSLFRVKHIPAPAGP